MFLSDQSKELNKFGKILLAIQSFTFFPILLIFARISMYVQTILMLFVKGGVPTMPWQKLHLPTIWNWMDRISQVIYFIWMYYIYTLVPKGTYWLFFIVQHIIVGLLFLHLTLNHWDRPTKHSSEETDNWFVKQVVTGRNQDCDWTNDWLLGGLHFQIEHHILPRLPRHSLAKFKENYVVPFCKKWDIPYVSSGFWHCAWDVMWNLQDVSKHVNDERIHKNTQKNKIFQSLLE
jgi:fatty acid desaturase